MRDFNRIRGDTACAPRLFGAKANFVDDDAAGGFSSARPDCDPSMM